MVTTVVQDPEARMASRALLADVHTLECPFGAAPSVVRG